jgi:hypothetical protein
VEWWWRRRVDRGASEASEQGHRLGTVLEAVQGHHEGADVVYLDAGVGPVDAAASAAVAGDRACGVLNEFRRLDRTIRCSTIASYRRLLR